MALSANFFACGGSEPAPKDANSASVSAVPTGSSALSETPPVSSGSTASPGSSPPGGDSSTKASIETAVRPKTTSTGGTYGLGAIDASGLDKDEVVRAVGAVSAKTDECYGKLFKKHLNAVGKTSFDIAVDGKGKTQSVKLKGDDLKDPDLPKCLEGVLRKVDWGKPTEKKGAKLSLEWVVAGN